MLLQKKVLSLCFYKRKNISMYLNINIIFSPLIISLFLNVWQQKTYSDEREVRTVSWFPFPQNSQSHHLLPAFIGTPQPWRWWAPAECCSQPKGKQPDTLRVLTSSPISSRTPGGGNAPSCKKKKSEKLNSLRVLLFLGLRAFAFNKTTRKSPRINSNKIFRLQITHFNLGNGRFLCCYAAFILPFQVYNKFVEFLELNYFSK